MYWGPLLSHTIFGQHQRQQQQQQPQLNIFRRLWRDQRLWRLFHVANTFWRNTWCNWSLMTSPKKMERLHEKRSKDKGRTGTIRSNNIVTIWYTCSGMVWIGNFGQFKNKSSGNSSFNKGLGRAKLMLGQGILKYLGMVSLRLGKVMQW